MASPTAEDIMAHAPDMLLSSPIPVGRARRLGGPPGRIEAELFVLAKEFIDCLFPDYSPTIRFEGKKLERTKELVAHGVDYLARKRHSKDLDVFNKAILVAPWRTRKTPKEEAEFCVAAVFGHRATVLFTMKRFAECIADTDQAFNLECPADLKESLLLQKAELFLTLKRPEEAVYTLVDEADVLHVRQRLFEEGDNLAARNRYKTLLTSAEKQKAYALKRKHHLPTAEPLKYKHPTSLEMCEDVKNLDMTYGRSRRFPSASAGMELKYDEQFGWHFVAKEKFNIGDVVLVEPSFLSFLNTSTHVLTQYCYVCCMYTETPFPCRECSSIVYCSAACANGSKAAVHAKECRFWRTLVVKAGLGSYDKIFPGNTNMAVIMATRAILMRTPQYWRDFYATDGDLARGAGAGRNLSAVIPEGAYLTESPYKMACWLSNMKRQHRDEVVFSMVSACVLAMKALEEFHFVGENAIGAELRNTLGGLLLFYAINFTGNWIGVEEQHMGAAGNASNVNFLAGVIHPTASFLKDSCNPNLFTWQYGDTLVVKAWRPVNPGDALCLNRIGHFADRDIKRRHDYGVGLGLECVCQPCTEKWPEDQVLADLLSMQGLQRVKCMGCSHVYDARDPDIPAGGQQQQQQPQKQCPQCGRNVFEWLLAFKAVHQKLISTERAGRRSRQRPPDENVMRTMLPYLERLFQLCGEPCYPVVHASRSIAEWMREQSLRITHPGRKAAKS